MANPAGRVLARLLRRERKEPAPAGSSTAPRAVRPLSAPGRLSLRPILSRRGMWVRFARNRGALVSLAFLTAFVLLVLGAPFATPHDPERNDLAAALAQPSVVHPFGTDHLGRDILARVLYGGRASLLIGLLAVGSGLIVGVPLGAVSGYYGGWVDLVIQRVIDVLLSLPGFLLALSLVAVFGVGLENVVIAVGLGIVPAFVRLVRSATLSIRATPYVETARGLGGQPMAIIRRHVLPNVLPPIAVQATLGFGSALLTAAGLGFLGLAVQQPTPEWGSMLGEGRQYIFSAPSLAAYPGLAIFFTVLATNLVGDGLRDALDPTQIDRPEK